MRPTAGRPTRAPETTPATPSRPGAAQDQPAGSSQRRSRLRRSLVSVLATALAAGAGATTAALPAAASEPVAPRWETVADGGSLADEVGRFTAASPTTNVGPDTTFVVGTGGKPPALRSAGINDLDVVATGYDTATGELRWHQRFDDGGAVDQAVSVEVNYNNNHIYVPSNSGSNVVVSKFAVRDGARTEMVRLPGAKATDSAISVAGGYMGIVGSRGGDFMAVARQTGLGQPHLDDTPVPGQALAADIPTSWSDPIDVMRTMVVTGRESGFGTGGDAYTAAYNYVDGVKLWERRWASPDNRKDEGVATAAAYVAPAGKGMAFVAGRTFTADRDWDTFVGAYDLATGAPVWDGELRWFDGEVSGGDEPVAIEYSPATATVYVTGTSERGVPHGEDVFVLAYDALSGERTGLAYGAGDASNGDDSPTGITVTPDGSRVLVGAHLQNIFVNGGRRAGMLAFDAQLRPAGRALLGAGGANIDHSGAVAVDRTGTRVLVGGSTDEGARGYDHRAAAFDVGALAVEPVSTQLSFTAGSPTSGQHTDPVTVSASLRESSGRAVAGQPVTVSLGNEQVTATTDAAGVATATFALDEAPGSYQLTATFDGDGFLLPSSATATFRVEREDTHLGLSVSGRGSSRTLTAVLTDGDDPSHGLSGQEISFTADGAHLGTAVTDGTGTATFSTPPGYRGGQHAFTASFAGNSSFLPSEAAASG